MAVQFAGLFIAACVALGQRYSFQPHGADLGLKNLNIELLHQDQTGFIWVATRNGFYRYDGYRFQPFDQKRGLAAPVIAIAGVRWWRDVGGDRVGFAAPSSRRNDSSEPRTPRS